jgi:hypothetical protein
MVCCHGTDNDSRNNDHGGDVGGGQYHVTQHVHDFVMGDKLLFEGAGSHEYQEKTGQWDLGSHGLLGIFFGKGVEHNKKECVRKLEEKHQNDGVSRVDLVGFSRGAVTCFKIAHALNDGPLRDVPVRLFAVDPVPGTSGIGNSHCWKAIKLMPNVKACKVVYAEHERRTLFRPVLVHGVNAGNNYEEDTMPGNHGGVADCRAEENEKSLAARLVLSQALEFFADGGTQFRGGMARDPLEDLVRYGKLMLCLGLYEEMGTLNKGWGENASKGVQFGGTILGGNAHGDRTMAAKRGSFSTLNVKQKVKAVWDFALGNAEKDKFDFDKQKMSERFKLLPPGSRFYCNKDHRDLFGTHFPRLAQWLGEIEVEGGKWGANDPRALPALNYTVNDLKRRTETYGEDAWQWCRYYLHLQNM